MIMNVNTTDADLPVVVIGAGPIGLAAAAHLLERGQEPLVLEAGDDVGAAIGSWGQVRLFSPWQYDIDEAARRLLIKSGWTEPRATALPTGSELIEQYLRPLAATDALSSRIRTGTRVVGVSRHGIDKTTTIDRENRPLLVRIIANGESSDITARAVIDASGTWGHPNPLGAAGLPAPGETDAARYQAGPLPDVLGRDRQRFAGRHTLVVGMGHSAANTLLALVDLADQEPLTRITWAIRRGTAARLYGGGDADGLPARGAIGRRLREAVEDGKVNLVRNTAITRLTPGIGDSASVEVQAETRAGQVTWRVDQIVNATGFRPDLDILREVRLELDPGTEAPTRLAPMIDPNFHSCGTVPAHGEQVLSHPEPGFYIVGAKSYGRAPTFLLATGYEQVRSIAAALAGDRTAADRVELSLPETGVCSSNPPTEDGEVDTTASAGDCCGPAPSEPVIIGIPTGLQHGLAGEPADINESSP